MDVLQPDERQRPFGPGLLLRVLLFAAANLVGLVVPLASSKVSLDSDSPLILPAIGLAAFAAMSMLWLRYWRQPIWCDLVPVLSWIVSLAFLREATAGTTLPYLSLLILVLWWLALYYPREQFALGASVVVVSVMFGLINDQASPVAWADGLERLSIGLATSVVAIFLIDRLRAQRDQLHYLAIADPLTGTANLRSWNTTMRQEMAWSKHHQQSFTLGIIRLSQLAEINRLRGFATGDALLVAATSAWMAELRDRDVLFRLQGSDFVVLLPGAHGRMAQVLLERIHKATPALGCAVGAATWDGRENVIELVERANNALRLAEEQGGDEVVLVGAQLVSAERTDDASALG